MWTENDIFRKDLEYLSECGFLPWKELDGKTVFVTGGTGLIGYTLVSALLYRALTHGEKIRTLLLVRDENKARDQYACQLTDQCDLGFVTGTVEELPDINEKIDYIVHGACPTASRFFTGHPVETAQTIFNGTNSVLELGRKKQAEGAVFLSSMEVYGEIDTRRVITEQDLGRIDLYSVRSVYSEGKRMAENLCCAYAAEYGVHVTVIRLCQTFGPGVKKEDGRVFAYMARSAMSGADICLSTAGKKENMYLYTSDAAGAILLTLLKGERGCVYNAGNPDTYCSVREMGETAARTLGKGSVTVQTNTEDMKGIYPPDSFLRLDISRLLHLGWQPTIGLEEMFRRMAACF